MAKNKTTDLERWRTEWPEEPPLKGYVAVDAGGTHGLAIWDRRNPDSIVLREPSSLQQLKLMVLNHLALGSDVIGGSYTARIRAKGWLMVSERFDIGNETIKSNAPVDSLYANGWLATEFGPNDYVEVSRGDAKGFTSSAKLKHYGWWQVGSGPHCRDAGRVLAYAMSHYDEPWLIEMMETYMRGQS